jgi:hypothetical protein
MRGSGILEWGENMYVCGSQVCVVRGKAYLSMDVATESEVADAEGSTATGGPSKKSETY